MRVMICTHVWYALKCVCSCYVSERYEIIMCETCFQTCLHRSCKYTMVHYGHLELDSSMLSTVALAVPQQSRCRIHAWRSTSSRTEGIGPTQLLLGMT